MRAACRWFRRQCCGCRWCGQRRHRIHWTTREHAATVQPAESTYIHARNLSCGVVDNNAFAAGPSGVELALDAAHAAAPVFAGPGAIVDSAWHANAACVPVAASFAAASRLEFACIANTSRNARAAPLVAPTPQATVPQFPLNTPPNVRPNAPAGLPPETPIGAVPEPSTWLMLGAGLGVLALLRSRRSNLRH